MTLHTFPRSFVGFDRLFNEIDRFNNNTKPSYPPHNLVKTSEDSYLLELSVAGYNPGDIEVSVDTNVLTIRTVADYKNDELEETSNDYYLHRGISGRSFVKKFTLHEYIEIESVDYALGILTIKLKQVIPDHKKPRVYDIGYENVEIKRLLNE